MIGSTGAFKTNNPSLATQRPPNNSGWAPGATGFAGFSFTTSASHKTDYGWVRLEFTDGVNGAADYVEALDWAYNTDGAPVAAGEMGTPEPSTSALGILAAGAAGVCALRRRRKASA